MNDLFVGLEGLGQEGFTEAVNLLRTELSTDRITGDSRIVSTSGRTRENGTTKTGEHDRTGRKQDPGNSMEIPIKSLPSSGLPEDRPVEEFIHLLIEPDYSTDLRYRWDGVRWRRPNQDEQWDDSIQLADHIRKRAAEHGENLQCRLVVDGSPVRLKEYPRSVLVKVIEGFVRSLSGVQPGREYEIQICTGRGHSDQDPP